MKRVYSNKKRQTVIEVGENVFLPYHAKISVPEECFLGKYCAFGYHVTIITTNHDISKPNLQLNMNRYYGFSTLELSKGPVTVGNNVWIGDNVTILSGVTIGDGCVVGAGAVVTDDLPACSIAVGIPAKTVKCRFDKKIIEQFLELKWWDWPEDKIARNRAFFETDLSNYKGPDLKDLICE
jgi:virginiamycin A acetyltransferase